MVLLAGSRWLSTSSSWFWTYWLDFQPYQLLSWKRIDYMYVLKFFDTIVNWLYTIVNEMSKGTVTHFGPKKVTCLPCIG